MNVVDGLTFCSFNKYLTKIRSILDFDEDVTNLFSKFGRECGYYEATFAYPHMADDCVKLLQILTKDEGDWIGYYVYELDFGRNYKPGDVKDDKGNNIPLQTTEDLWNILQEVQSRRG